MDQEHKAELAAVQAHWRTLPHAEAARMATEAVNLWDGDTYEAELARAHVWAKTASTPEEKALLLVHSRGWIEARRRWAQATPEEASLGRAQAEHSASAPGEKVRRLAIVHEWELAERVIERRFAQAEADRLRKARASAWKQIGTGWNDYWATMPEWVRWAAIAGALFILYALTGPHDPL